MRLTLAKEVLVFALLASVLRSVDTAVDPAGTTMSADKEFKNEVELTQTETAVSESTVDVAPKEAATTNITEEAPKTEQTNEAESIAVIPVVNLQPEPEPETVVDSNTTIKSDADIIVNTDGIVEKNVENTHSSGNENEPIRYRLTLLGLILFISGTLTAFGAALLIFSSIYYRIYLKENKTAPFEAPDFFNLLFPKPVNNEIEINNLCARYLDN